MGINAVDDTFVREFEVSNEIILKIHQKMIGDEGCVVWDAALVLAKFLIYNQNQSNKLINLVNSTIIELGAGTGIVGITAAVLGADVILTDISEYVDLMQKNIEYNQLYIKGKIQCKSLYWGKSDEEFAKCAPKYILVSDCVYYKQSLEPLFETLSNLSGKDTTIIFSYEKRFSDEKQAIESAFFKLIITKFDVKEVTKTDLHPEYQSPDIKVLLFTKKE
ncbi:Methyltransferase-like protein 21D [Chamberlinius hualienensis]